jgi:hypothetical protein
VKEVLESSRAAEYFTNEGLRTLTGLPESLWLFAVLKELVDNALDAIDTLGIKRVDLEPPTTASRNGGRLCSRKPWRLQSSTRPIFWMRKRTSSRR